MRLLAAVSSAVAMALAVGLMTGVVRARPRPRRAGPQVSRRQRWLIQAGLEVTPRQYWSVSLGAAGAAFLVSFLLTGVAAVSLAPAGLVAFLPRAYYGRIRDRRLVEVQQAWPDGLRDLVASIAAGMSLQRAVENLASTGPEPLQRAFGSFPFLARTLGMIPALEVVKEELADPTSDRVIEILSLAHQRGGQIVPEILRDLAEATVRDVWTIEEIQTQALELKINARAVFALPWLLLILMTARNGIFRDFYSSSAGLLVVAVGAGMSGLGMALVSRLGRDPEEPRVLGGAAAEGAG